MSETMTGERLYEMVRGLGLARTACAWESLDPDERADWTVLADAGGCRMTTTTPGQRLHAALLAHGIEYGAWDSYHPLTQRDFERAARVVGADGDLRDRLDALAAEVAALHEASDDTNARVTLHSDGDANAIDAVRAEVAALRRDRENDLVAFGEIGDRLARTEAAVAEVVAHVGRIADRFVAEQRAAVAGRRLARDHDRDHADRLDRLTERVAALEARAIDGGDPLRRTA